MFNTLSVDFGCSMAKEVGCGNNLPEIGIRLNLSVQKAASQNFSGVSCALT